MEWPLVQPGATVKEYPFGPVKAESWAGRFPKLLNESSRVMNPSAVRSLAVSDRAVESPWFLTHIGSLMVSPGLTEPSPLPPGAESLMTWRRYTT